MAGNRGEVQLRKFSIVQFAEAGASDAQIQAMTGQSAEMVAYYRAKKSKGASKIGPNASRIEHVQNETWAILVLSRFGTAPLIAYYATKEMNYALHGRVMRSMIPRMGRTRTDESRKDAVRIALTSGLTRMQVADDLGVACRH